ncbi:MAG: hypothetical protein AAF745_08625 [Planctomycetota bacterium]
MTCFAGNPKVWRSLETPYGDPRGVTSILNQRSSLWSPDVGVAMPNVRIHFGDVEIERHHPKYDK